MSSKKKFKPKFPNCYKCGRVIIGQVFTTRVQKRDLTIIRASNPNSFSGMHETCAQAWVSKNKITPETGHKDPEVEAVRQKLEKALKLVNDAQNVARGFEIELDIAIWRYHKKQLKKLRGNVSYDDLVKRPVRTGKRVQR